jgi:hypothetical protein
MGEVTIRVGDLECRRAGEEEGRFEVRHHLGENCYVVMYFRLDDEGVCSYETVGERPWSEKVKKVPVWAFARACALLLYTLREGGS